MTDAGFRPDLVIAVDWSAASSPKPKQPSPDAPWIAWGFRDDPPRRRPAPEYFRTRAACEARIRELLSTHTGSDNISALIGFDFPLGYPLATDGSPVLPIGRALCEEIAARIEDGESNRNNRFDVAEALNTEIAERFNEPHGPYWGCPPNRSFKNNALLPTRRTMHAVLEYRAVEQQIRRQHRLAIHSPWKLFTTGSVGSQTLLGLPMIHRLLTTLGDRAKLWPFESVGHTHTPTSNSPIVFTEIWPSLHDADADDHPIKDARQVVAVRDALLASTNPLPSRLPASASAEGWIAGVQPPSTEPESVCDA